MVLLVALVCCSHARSIAFLFPLVALLSWLYLDIHYALSLGASTRSDRRERLDRVVTVQTATVVGVPMALYAATTLLAAPKLDDWSFAVIVTALAVMDTIAYLSSLVDWYYTRTRVDGIVCYPPCIHSSRESDEVRNRRWQSVTRRWYMHRSVAWLVGVVSAIVAVAGGANIVLSLASIAEDNKLFAILVGIVPAIIGIIIASPSEYVSNHGKAVSAWWSPPLIFVGDVIDLGDDRRWYVRDIAVDRMTLVLLDPPDGDTIVKHYSLRSVDHDFRRKIKNVSPCSTDACRRINQDAQGCQCDFDDTRLRHGGSAAPRHVLIL